MRTSTPGMRGETAAQGRAEVGRPGTRHGVCRRRLRRCDNDRDHGDDNYERGTGTPNHRVHVHDGTLPAYALARMSDPRPCAAIPPPDRPGLGRARSR